MSDIHVDLAKSLVAGSLDLICPTMELLVCPQTTELALAGSGVIRSDEHGRLYFRMVAPFLGKPHRALERHRPPGELYASEDHVILRAVDHQNREWRSEPLLVHLTFPFTKKWVIRENVPLLSSDRTWRSDPAFTQIYIPRITRLPFDRSTTRSHRAGGQEIEVGWAVDHHTHRIGDAEIEFRELERSWLLITARPQTGLLPEWHRFICQALTFVASQNVRPAVIVESAADHERVQLITGPFWRTRPMPGPVPRSDERASFWRFVEHLFLYAHERPQHGNALFDELAGIRSGAMGSIQTACLTLAIGVESLVRLLLVGKTVPPVADAEKIDSLLAHVRAWPVDDESIRTRAIAMLGQLKSTSTADTLYAWARDTGTPEILVDRWKKLRHPKAHGAAVEEGQNLYDVYCSVTEVMYRLVAGVIGYTGPIIPLSQRGWDHGGPTSRRRTART